MISISKKTAENLYVTTLMLICLTIRISTVNDYPLFDDEFLSVQAMKSIVSEGYPIQGDGSLYWRALLPHYIMAIPLFFFEPTILTTRFMSILFSVMSIFVVFRMGKQAGDTISGMLAATFLAFSAYMNMDASIARFYTIFQFFFLCAAYYIGEYFFTSRKCGILLLLSVIAALSSHRLSLELFLVFAICTLISNQWKKLLSLRALISGALVALATWFFLFYSPQNTYSASTAIPLTISGMDDKLFFLDSYKKFVSFGPTLLILSLIPLAKGKNRIWGYYFVSFVTSMVLLSVISPLQNIRYFCNIFPLGVLLAVLSLSWWAKAIVTFLKEPKIQFNKKALLSTPVILAAIFYLLSHENTQISKNFGHWAKYFDHKPPHDLIKKGLLPGDIVISQNTGMTNHYLGISDSYFLRQKLDRNLRQWTAFPDSEKSPHMIDTEEKLQQLLDSKARIWIYATHQYKMTVGFKMKRLIDENFKIVTLGPNYTIYLHDKTK